MGRPRIIGGRLPTLSERLADPTTPWQRFQVSGWYGGGERLVEIISGTAIWHHPGKHVPIRYVLVRAVAGAFKPQAFLCLECTAPVGLTLAMRVSRPETFAMTCGVMVPTNAVLIDEVLEEVQGRVRGEPGAIANDRRFATAIYRIAVMSGIMDQIGFASPG